MPDLQCSPKPRNLSLALTRNAVGSTHLKLFPPEGPTNLCLAHFRDAYVKKCKSRKPTDPVQECRKGAQFITHFPPAEVTSNEGRKYI